MKGWQNRLELANKVREKNSQIITQINTGISYLRIPYICNTTNIADNLLAESRKHGLGIVGMYPSAICEIPDINEHYSVADYSAAVSIAPRLVTLPSHQMLNKIDMANLKEYIARYDMHLVNPSIQSARH